MNSGSLRLAFADDENALRALAALEPDNDDRCTMHVEGATLIVLAEATKPLGILRTLDDVLACLRALEEVEGQS